jgi:hypothetical protein
MERCGGCSHYGRGGVGVKRNLSVGQPTERSFRGRAVLTMHIWTLRTGVSKMEQCRAWVLPHPVPRSDIQEPIVSIEDFKREMTNSTPTKGPRPLRDIDMTKRTEKQEPVSPTIPESEGDTSSE